MADPEHLELLQQGVGVWNEWREKEPSISPDLRRANLNEADLRRVDLRGANLSEADLSEANLLGANLNGANLHEANLHGAQLGMADLRETNLSEANLGGAFLSNASLDGANLHGAKLGMAFLAEASLSGANLSGAYLWTADLRRAYLSRAKLLGADLSWANLQEADLSMANLSTANLHGALLLETDLTDAILTDCRIYGISAWGVKLNERTKQQGLIITPAQESAVTIDDLEVAQFVYLLLHNDKIRRVIDTVGKKGVLLLGRFTEGRMAVLDRLRDELRKRDYLPIVFNFDKPETKDLTETVRLLAGLSKFVIADLTSPKSAPYELGAIVSQTMIPFQPIITAGETPFAMLQDLWINHPDRVFRPIHYSSVDALIASLDEKIIQPAEARFIELLKRKADTMGGEHV
jgi:uncharacterized protein YjbI with pentapeptide repeats